MSVLQTGNMLYRNFGNSGLKVSVISLGNMINYKPENYEEDKQIIATSLKNGINHFDTAQIYAFGEAEIVLGRILKQLQVPREQIVIATKVHTAPDPDLNSTKSTNRKHIRQSVQKSLKRLQMDYVDIIYAHLPDSSTPIEQICRGFNEVIERGQAFYWATSNWDASAVFQALATCERLNLHKPIGGQNEYSMLVRTENQIEYESLYTKYNYGLIGWSPLCGGTLTGRHLDGINQNQLSRFTDNNSSFSAQFLKNLFYLPYSNEKTTKSLLELKKIAQQQLGVKLTHLALAWAIKYTHNGSALIGARTVQQLEDCLAALPLLDKFTVDLQKRINKILDNNPTPRFDFKSWKSYEPIRPIAKQ